jgi:hypothetical protein
MALCAQTTRCCAILAEIASECGKVVATGSDSVGAEARDSLQLALDVLAEVNMTTFPLLAGGAIPIGRCDDVASAGIVELSDGGSPDDLAEAILAWASRAVLTRWQAVLSEWTRRGPAIQPVRDLAEVIALHTRCLHYEYYQRSKLIQTPWRCTGMPGTRLGVLMAELLQTPPTVIFTSSPNESIVAELVSYHYPFWDRAYFCFNSPWDDLHVPGDGDAK